uniref:tRNA pseudouridine synthase n=1 Tax=Oryza punctata TaxID=4537 RepID=A0A0E0MKI7_ORYPU
MSAATPNSSSSKRPIDASLADPSPPAKLQRSSQPDPSPPAELEGDATNGGGGEVAAVRSGEMAGARNPRAQRYLVAVEYIGTRFSGSQQQLNQRTVVGVLEDTGVHALSNVCHVDVERISKRKPGEVKNDGDIMVTDVRCVAPDFHARYKALERTYHYRLLSGSEPLSVFEKTSAWHIPEDLNVQAMKANSPMRTLDELSVTEVFPSMFFPSSLERSEMESLDGPLVYSRTSVVESSGKGSDASSTTSEQSRFENGEEFGKRLRHRCFVVTARARSFLYHQVRLMVGLLKSVGTGDLTTEDVERILNSKAVTAAPPMAPACGLYLANVKYDLSV